MPIFGSKSTFLEPGILAVQRRELIIEEVHNISTNAKLLSEFMNIFALIISKYVIIASK